MSLFVTFEGIEGSGKSTQIKKLSDFLSQKGYAVCFTREPGGTWVGEQLRKILLNNQNTKMVSLCELFLYAADRAQHCEEVIVPALKKGQIVLCDRFADATTAYQEGGRGLSKDLVAKMNHLATSGLKPTLTFLFDCPVKIGISRAEKRNLKLKDNEDRFEKEELLFHEKVRQHYLKIAEEEKKRFIVIDATKEIEDIHQIILKRLNPFLKNEKNSPPS